MSTKVNKVTTGKKGKTAPRQAISFLEKNSLVIVVIIGVFGLILRLYRLGYLSLWVDEYMHAIAAMNGKFSHGENNGILLTWINTTLSYIIGHGEFALRFPVAVLGATIIVSVYGLGKHIANYKVGLMSAILTALSIYLIFWSRVDRPYGMVAAFYIPALLAFWLSVEKPSGEENAWSKLGINRKYFFYMLLAFLLSMLSQLICFLFVFTAGFYGTFMTIDNWITKKSRPFRLNAYSLLFYLNILVVFFMFTPWGTTLTKPFLELFLPKNIATFILPDIKNIKAILASKEWDKCFNTYYNVLANDFKGFFILGCSGFVLAFIGNRKLGYFLLSSFVIPFLLLSFIFTSTSHAKYLIQIYPVFLISIAYCLYFIAFNVLRLLDRKFFSETSKSYMMICSTVFVIMVFVVTPRKEIKAMLTTENHGNMVDKHLAEIHFVNWRQPCEYLIANKQPNDVIMSTVKDAPRYYLGLDSVVWFRQMHLNPKWTLNSKVDQYIPNKPGNRKLSANTYEELVRTFNENPRGWLLADYYFDNALTDPRAKEFVERNFTFHFDACEDGAVKVFSWDKAKPIDYDAAFVIELGKNDNQQASQEFTVSITKASLPPKVNMHFLSQGIDSDQEAFVQINGERQAAIPNNGKSSQVGENTITLDPSYFKDGENKIQFFYNNAADNGDITRGFVLYNMDIR